MNGSGSMIITEEIFTHRISACITCPRSGVNKTRCELDGVSLHDHANGVGCREDGGGRFAELVGVTVTFPPAGTTRRVAPPKLPPTPLPERIWPKWAKLLGRKRQAGEIGVGDTAKRLTGEMGEKYRRFRKWLGIPCKCEERREEWNVSFRYGDEQ